VGGSRAGWVYSSAVETRRTLLRNGGEAAAAPGQAAQAAAAGGLQGLSQLITPPIPRRHGRAAWPPCRVHLGAANDPPRISGVPGARSQRYTQGMGGHSPRQSPSGGWVAPRGAGVLAPPGFPPPAGAWGTGSDPSPGARFGAAPGFGRCSLSIRGGRAPPGGGAGASPGARFGAALGFGRCSLSIRGGHAPPGGRALPFPLRALRRCALLRPLLSELESARPPALPAGNYHCSKYVPSTYFPPQVCTAMYQVHTSGTCRNSILGIFHAYTMYIPCRAVTTFPLIFPNFISPNLGKFRNFPNFFTVFGGPISEPPKLTDCVDFPLLGKLGKLGKRPVQQN
jgi:hypothetical protein